jgi:hypothetical protein
MAGTYSESMKRSVKQESGIRIAKAKRVKGFILFPSEARIV